MRTAMILALGLLVGATAVQAETRFHQYTAKFKTVADPADPVQAGYLGGSGTEWLAGGGWLPDGSIVVAGSALGPTLELAGQTVASFGADGSAPEGFSGEIGKKTSLWDRDEATGFIAVFDQAGKRVVRTVRFPWQAASVTDCLVAADGGIYVAGRVGPQGGQIPGIIDHNPGKDQDADKRTQPVYLARFESGLGKPTWIARMQDFDGEGATLHERKDGSIYLESGWGYVFNASGDMTDWTDLWVVNSWNRGIDPESGAFALGWDRNTHTGREPWRKPHLHVFNKDGTEDVLYEWDAKLVGIDSLRLVSDSEPKVLSFDREGHLLFYGWSDGGNTVFERNPYDIRQGSPHEGLGFSSWGANATSNCNLVKVDVETGEVLGKTLWLGFLSSRNAPSGTSIKTIDSATDGSVVITGGTAFGTIQTGNNLHPEDDRPGGNFVTVLRGDLNDLRFSSNMLACAAIELNKKSGMWRCNPQVSSGRHKVLLTCAAEKEGSNYTYNGPYPAPSKAPVQASFGGGVLDGYFLVLDLGAK